MQRLELIRRETAAAFWSKDKSRVLIRGEPAVPVLPDWQPLEGYLSTLVTARTCFSHFSTASLISGMKS